MPLALLHEIHLSTAPLLSEFKPSPLHGLLLPPFPVPVLSNKARLCLARESVHSSLVAVLLLPVGVKLELHQILRLLHHQHCLSRPMEYAGRAHRHRSGACPYI
jgi:hypothetical protein